jgi:ABC-type multidrug transport system ATPase subunit
MRLRREQLPADLMTVLDLQDKLDMRIATLSGGFQRRVELAKALLTDPAVLVLDEPFTGLDVNVRDGFFATLRGITAQRGLTTVLITHELGLAGLCDRVVLLETGSVIADAQPAELLTEFGRTVVEITTSNIPAMEERFARAGEKQTLRLRKDALLIKSATLQEVLQTIDELDASIRDMQMRRPSLEDYFIARTGHGVFDGKEELLEA